MILILLYYFLNPGGSGPVLCPVGCLKQLPVVCYCQNHWWFVEGQRQSQCSHCHRCDNRREEVQRNGEWYGVKYNNITVLEILSLVHMCRPCLASCRNKLVHFVYQTPPIFTSDVSACGIDDLYRIALLITLVLN